MTVLDEQAATEFSEFILGMIDMTAWKMTGLQGLLKNELPQPATPEKSLSLLLLILLPLMLLLSMLLLLIKIIKK